MSETNQKIETKALNLRVKKNDHDTVTNFLKEYDPKHEGFSELVKMAFMPIPGQSTEELTNSQVFDKLKFEQLSPEQQNSFLENIFAADFYKNFVDEEQPNHALFAIIEGMRFANQKKFELNAIDNTPGEVKTNNEQIDETKFVPEDLKHKVEILRRHLISKKKLLEETTQAEYLKELLKYSLRYFLLNEYPEIYKR